MARSTTATTTTTTAQHPHHLHPPPTSAPGGHIQLLKPPPPRNGFHGSSIGVVGDKIPAIPGFKTSAAFLSSLGANLCIPDSDLLPSPLGTPPSLRASVELSTALPPPSPLAFTTTMPQDDEAAAPTQSEAVQSQGPDAPKDPFDGVPALTTFVADSADDKVVALKLVADSIAQQRQMAGRILTTHPLNIAVFGAFVAVVAQLIYNWRQDLTIIFTTLSGLVMTYLATVRFVTRGYIAHAEELKWEWLNDDTVIVTKFGDDVIGAVILGWEKGEKGTRRKKSGRGIIRAWTVRYKYRHKGVGRALLEETVKLVGERGGDGIEFAEDHANSLRVLKPDFFNKAFDRREKQAQDMLDDVVAEQASWRKK